MAALAGGAPRLSPAAALLIGLGSPVLLVVLWIGLNVALRHGQSVVPPNGMIVERRVQGVFRERWDLSGVDGAPLLLRGADLMCFNDRYVEASGWAPGAGGLFVARTNARIAAIHA